MADNPNVGPEPVDAKPNHRREKTYSPPNSPEEGRKEKKELPEGTTREKASGDMSEATNEVKKRL